MPLHFARQLFFEKYNTCIVPITTLSVIIDWYPLTQQEETEVQEQGCCALCNIATNQPEIQNKICSIGGLECVLSALTIHRYDEMVVGNALSALQTLCSYNKVIENTIRNERLEEGILH